MLGEKRLVCGHYMFSTGHCLEQERPSRLISAYQLNNHIHFRMLKYLIGVCRQQPRVNLDSTVGCDIQVGYFHNLNFRTQPLPDGLATGS